MNALIEAIVCIIAQRWRSKTYLFASLVIVLGMVLQFMPLLQSHMTPEVYGALVSGIGIVVAVLREVTTSSLIDKAPPQPDEPERL